MTGGLVSIVTPTIPGREGLLIGRCAPSVRGLVWDGPVEHVIVSDRNPTLQRRSREIAGPVYRDAGSRGRTVRVVEINETWRDGTRERSVGAVPWAVGSLLALGDWIGFCADDDELLPDHAGRHISVMEATGAAFTVSRVRFDVAGRTRYVIGDASMQHGHLDSDGIMCRPAALQVASWTATGEDAADYRLVRDWLHAGLRGEFVGGPPTAIHHDGWAAR